MDIKKITLSFDLEQNEPVWGFIEMLADLGPQGRREQLKAIRELAHEDIASFVEDCEWTLEVPA